MIYFDYAATSKKRKYIIEEIFGNFDDFDGNPESQHTSGRRARSLMDQARKKIADSINARPDQIVFTSGASESNNMIINAFKDRGRIVSTTIEHPSILNTIKDLTDNYTLIKPDRLGKFSLESIKSVLDKPSVLLSFSYVNNEIGNIYPVEEFSKLAKNIGAWLHIDAVQAYGHLEIDVEKIQCDSMSLSGHKIGGLNGFGVIYVRDRVDSLIHGGNQEKKRRAGTSFVLGAYSMAKAFDDIVSERPYIKELKNYCIEKLNKEEIDYEINGDLENSSDHILNIFLPFVKSDFLLTFLDMKGICASAGSACTAGSLEPSFVIAEMHDEQRAYHSLRLSFGYDNKKEDIDKLVEILQELNQKSKTL